ncbi:MAG: YidH family protein [Solirubrobacterales bacterium]
MAERPGPDDGWADRELRDASRRTRLAGERTQLAWWRTGLTALAVALGVGRVIPELDPGVTRWPYSLIGVGFALYGVALIAYGSVRSRAVERSLAAGGPMPSDRLLGALTASGAALGLATGLLIVFD